MLILPSDKYGCGYYRSIKPHEFISKNYADLFDITIMFGIPKEYVDSEEEAKKFFSNYDIVHIHKSFDKEAKIAALAKSNGCKLIIDIDDYYDLGNEHPMSLTSRLENWKEPIIKHLKMADMVTTTTDIFRKELLKLNGNVVVLPNAIDPTEEQFVPKPTKSDKVRFGIICGSSHLNDIKLLSGMVKTLSKETLSKIQFVLCGFDTNGTRTLINKEDGTKKVINIQPHESCWAEYEKIITDNYNIISPNYKNFLLNYIKDVEYQTDEPYMRYWTRPIEKYATHYNNIDVLLVPLKDNKFNTMKSQLKVIEAGFFNKAIIASNVGPYTIDLKPMIGKNGVINEDGNALLVDPIKNHKLWSKYITRLANDRELLNKLQTNLNETVKDRYHIATVCKDRVEAYLNLVKK